MKLLQGDPRSWQPVAATTATAIGVFDGVHRGHQQVLEDLEQHRGALRTILTFDPHPLALVSPTNAPRLLGTLDQRLEWLESCGADVVGVLAFETVREMEPEEFVKSVLVGKLNTRVVAVGKGFRFGRDRRGDVGLLRSRGEEHGFVVDEVELLSGTGAPISSTHIRHLVAEGSVDAAAELLGRPYTIRGPVVRGDGRGRTIGIPTANVDPSPLVVLPGNGVYAVQVVFDGSVFAGVANVGTRPTFGGGSRVVEAHLLEGEHELYGRVIDVAFVENLRPEEKFEGPEALVRQIRLDIEKARNLLRGRIRER